VVPIVPHHEIPIFRNNHQPKGSAGISRFFIIITVLVIKGLAIDEELLVLHLDSVTRDSDDPFYEIFALVLRVNEDNDVPPPGGADRDQGCLEIRELNPVKEFVHQDMVAYQQGRLHGSGRDLEGLNHKRSDKQGEKNRDSGCFGVFPYGALLFYSFRPVFQTDLPKTLLDDR